MGDKEKAKRVFLGVGHGGNDPGAVANGLREKDMNLVTALRCKEVLENAGVVVGISRIIDGQDPLVERIKEAIAFKPDIAFDIHYNAGGGDGFEAYIQTGDNNSEGFEVAKAIETEVKAIGQNSRGIKTRKNSSGTDYFGWLRQLDCVALLLEGAFIDSEDRKLVDTEAEQKAMGEAYAGGILKYLGINPAKPTIYRVQVGAFEKEQFAKNLLAKLKAAGFDGFITRV